MAASGEFRGLVRAVGLLRRSAPVGTWLLVVLPVAGGIAPAVTAAATGALGYWHGAAPTPRDRRHRVDESRLT